MQKNRLERSYRLQGSQIPHADRKFQTKTSFLVPGADLFPQQTGERRYATSQNRNIKKQTGK